MSCETKSATKTTRAVPVFGVVAALLVAALMGPGLFAPSQAWAQQTDTESDPAAALIAALSAACRADQNQFANYLTTDSAMAFRALPAEQRAALLKRFALAEGAGRPLLSSSANHPVLRCEAPEVTVEFRLGEVRTRENLAFLSVSVASGEQTEFGLVRENGRWRLLSLGLLLLDVTQLSKQWSQQNVASNDDTVPEALQNIAGAVQIYQRAFGRIPSSLAQLGPAPPNEISPEQAALIDEDLAQGAENGFRFRYHIVTISDGGESGTGAAVRAPKFEVSATPEMYGQTGRRSFLLDTRGIIHAADHAGSPGTVDDPVVENEKKASETPP